jgi:hypothetical protein
MRDGQRVSEIFIFLQKNDVAVFDRHDAGPDIGRDIDAPVGRAGMPRRDIFSNAKSVENVVTRGLSRRRVLDDDVAPR